KPGAAAQLILERLTRLDVENRPSGPTQLPPISTVADCSTEGFPLSLDIMGVTPSRPSTLDETKMSRNDGLTALDQFQAGAQEHCDELQHRDADEAPSQEAKLEKPVQFMPSRAITPFQVPPLPSYFVSRPEMSQALKLGLLANEVAVSGVLVVSAIHGMGGIGKSVLAAALCHDGEMQNHFSGGILWGTLGQNPDLISLLSSWIQALDDVDFRPTTEDAASNHLRTLLHNSATLLVLDDVWNPDHVRPFLVGGPLCRMLITTRRADVADEFGAKLYELGVMLPDQALQLLLARLGRPSLEGVEGEEALLLSEVVGYLPLALDLVAVRVARGVAWTELRYALEEEIARLEVIESPHRRLKGETRLEACFNLSLNTLRASCEEVWRAFVW